MIPDHSTYDCIIVGARVAGAASALLLARAGLRVLVIDRGDRDDDAVSTHALMRPAVTLLARWGVLDAIVAAGTPAIRSATFHYGDAASEVAIKPRDGIDALYAPRRTVLDRLLVDAARNAGAEVHHHVKLLDIARDDRGRICGVVLLSESRTACVRTDLIIGADGIGSAVARLVGARSIYTGVHASSTLYTHVPGLAVEGYHWYYRPGVSAGLVPTNGGACVFALAPSARYKSELRHDPGAGYRRVLEAAMAPDVPPLQSDALPLRLFAGRPSLLRRAWGPGWALVGDAGAFRDPITAHGITDALRDALLLADELRTGQPGALARYELRRDEVAMPLVELTDAIASFAWDLGELQDLHARVQRELAREQALVLSLTSADAPGPAASAA